MSSNCFIQYPLIGDVDVEHGNSIATPGDEPDGIRVCELASKGSCSATGDLEVAFDERLLCLCRARKSRDAMMGVVGLILSKNARHCRQGASPARWRTV